MATGWQDQADVVVIGAGIHGMSTAYNLAARGCPNVVVVDKGSIGSGATGRSGGIVRQQYTNAPMIELAIRSRQIFETLQQEIGGDPGFVQNGYIFLATEREARGLEYVVATQQRLGIKSDLVPFGVVREIFPDINLEGIALAAFERDSGYAEPQSTLMAYVDKARELGVKIHQDTRVVNLLASNGRVTGVETTRGTIRCEHVVAAAGPWNSQICAMAGISLPFRFIRLQEAVVRPLDGYSKFLPTLHCEKRVLYVRPEAGGLVLGGGTPKAEEQWDDPDRFRETADPEFVVEFAQALSATMNRFANADFVRGWAGIGGMTPDNHPVIGALPGASRLWLAADSSHGFKLGPVMGRVMAELILLGRTETMDIQPFSFSRFAEGRTFRSKYTNFPWF